MKHFYKQLFTMFLFCSASVAYSQNESDISNFLQASGKDASKLMEAYIKPAITSVSYGMTGGWYTTAKPHKSFGFDIGATITLAFVPTSENYFNPQSFLSSNTTFSNVTNPGKGAPTIFGPKDQTQYTAAYDPDGNGPAGTETFTFKDRKSVV